jgi:hypothetical protein
LSAVGRHAGQLIDLFSLEVENVLQGLLPRLLEHARAPAKPFISSATCVTDSSGAGSRQ